MSLHKGMDKFIDRGRVAAAPTTVGPWQFQYPNTADFNFNYWALLNNAKQTAIAQNNNANFKIAVIGAGVAGLVAARELYRSGFVNIDIYEASDRLGGRNYSLPPVSPNQYTTFEMGAMRMPFFWPYDPLTNSAPNNGGPGSQNCVLDYYCTNFGITTQIFPDPGSSGVASTGIYTNNGLGPDPANPVSPPQLDIWETGQLPPTAILKAIYAAWSQFANLFQQTCYPFYGTDQWEPFWQTIVQQYWTYNFRDLVYLPQITEYDPSNPGYFGGLGLTETEAWDFYVIGAGDGGWGAFFDISCLYPIRTLLFGFGDVHQLIQGTFNNGVFNPGLQYQQTTKDNLGNLIAPPNYLGVQTVADCLFYQPVTSPYVGTQSLYQATQTLPGVNLYTRTPVNTIQYNGPNNLQVYTPAFPNGKQYNAVILTTTTWATEMSGNNFFSGFGNNYDLLPYYSQLSIRESHWITSCKVFYPLKTRYWENNVSPIPQVINTDTFLQDIYAYAVDIGNDPGVLLVSYTWEDDAIKIEALLDNDGKISDQKLASACIAELDNFLMNCSNINTKVSQYVNTNVPVVIHWERMPTYRGCAKLYRERSWDLDYALLTYNQNYSAQSGLYFAGEAYSVEGGWTEPALRLGLDAVINLVNNMSQSGGAQFLNGFSYSYYPQYSSWSPATVS